VWTVLERHPDLAVAEAARRASCSFATAWQTAQDFRMLQQAGQEPGNAGASGRPPGMALRRE